MVKLRLRAGMRDLTERVLACCVLAFATGIAAAKAFGPIPVIALACIGVVCAAAWAATRRRTFAGAAALVFGAMAGSVALLSSHDRPARDVSRLPPGGQTITGTVAGAPAHRRGLWRFVLAAERHDSSGAPERLTGRVYVRIRSSQAVGRGQRWRLTGRLRPLREAANPGQRSEAATLASLGVSCVLTVGSDELAEMLGEGRMGPISRHAFAAQTRAREMLETNMPGPFRDLTAAVASSVIFGVHAAPPAPEVTEVFRRAGTIHLLVVSGAMVSTVFGLVFLPGALGAGWRRVRFERQFDWPAGYRGRVRLWPGQWAAIIAMAAVTYYAVLTEGGQAVARAAIMGVLAAGALVLRRTPLVAREHGLNVDHYTLLAAAAIAILAVTPGALFQAGFQLSFAAVWAILYLTPEAMPLVGWLPRWLGYIVVGTCAAQLATFPILMWHFGQAPVAGLGANLLAVPLAGIVLVGGMVTCGLGAALPPLAPAAGWVTALSARWIVLVSSFFAGLPGATVNVARPGMLAIALWYTGLLGLGWLLGRRQPQP